MVEEGSDPSDKDVIAKANREWDRRNFFALKILFNTSKFYENFHYFYKLTIFSIVSDKIQISDELAVISQRNAFSLWSAIVGTGLFDII